MQENQLIESWKKGATLMKEMYEKLNQKFDIKAFAKRQLDLLEETKPLKDYDLKQQVKDTQYAFIEYLEDVIETGEL